MSYCKSLQISVMPPTKSKNVNQQSLINFRDTVNNIPLVGNIIIYYFLFDDKRRYR